MAREVQRITLTGVLELALEDGSVIVVRPGPAGKGISIIPPTLSRGRRPTSKGGPRGRKPSTATTMLREKLAKDKDAKALREAAFYIRWLVDKANIGLKQAQPVVYRELRALR